MESQTNSEGDTTNEEKATTETNTTQEASSQKEGERSQQRTFAILGYVLPFLFFLPLLDDKTKDVPYVRFHANQQLIILIAIFAVHILHSFVLIMLLQIGYLIYQVLMLAIVALMIIGGVNAYKEKEKELPYVGQFRILK